MPQDIPTTCNGFRKKFLIELAPSCPKGGLVLVRNSDAAKEWGAFGSQDLVSSAFYMFREIGTCRRRFYMFREIGTCRK